MFFNKIYDLIKLEKLISKQNEFFYPKYKNYHKIKFKKISNEVFLLFIEQLNKSHNINLSKKSWKIIIGPWFYSIFNIYFYYRYCFSQKKILMNKKIKKIILDIKLDRKIFVPLNFSEYIKYAYSRKFIIHFIYIMLSSNLLSLKISNIKLKKNSFSKFFFLNFFYKINNLKVILSRPKFKKLDQLKIYILSGFKTLCIPALDPMFDIISLKKKKKY